MEVSKEFQIKLIKLAQKETIFDIDENYCIDDCAGGNVDDAYYRGSSDGEIYMAREVLDELGISYLKE